MNVDRTNSLNHREELTVNFHQELCTDCHAIEARFAAIVDHMAEAFISINSDWYCTIVNRKAEQLLNRKRQDLIGKTIWTVFSVDPTCELYQHCHRAIATPTAIEFEQHYSSLNQWLRIRLIKSEDGLFIYFLDIAETSQVNRQIKAEIAHCQQVEANLQKEQDFLKAILNNVQAGIVACDAEGILTVFNKAAQDFHGLPQQPVPSERWAYYYNLYLPDGKTRMNTEDIPLFRALQGQNVRNVEMMIVSPQGTARTLLATGQAIIAPNGEKQGAVVVMHDITERKQIEEERVQLVQEQAARAVAENSQQQSAFLAEMSAVLSSSLEYEQTLQSVANLAVPYFADWCSVDLLNDDRTISRVAVAHCEPEKVKFGWELAQRFPRHLDDGYGISQVMQTGQVEIATEITDEQLVAAVQNAEYLEILRGVGLKSCIIAPLQARGRVLGSISFIFTESERRYRLEDIALAEDLARRAAIAIDNARLYNETQQAKLAAELAANRTARLLKVMMALSESLTSAQVAQVIIEQGISALGASCGLVRD